jgi:signal transduction histidine kinase
MSQTPVREALGRRSDGVFISADNRPKILLVDDRADKLLALEVALASLGQNLVSAHSGAEALRLLLQHDFAVIILDVSMPTMDGFETAVLIRERKKSELTPIIFVSAVDCTDSHLARGYSLGAVDYIPAPIVPEILRAKVSFFVELYKKTEQLKQQAEIEAQLIRAEAARQQAEEANRAKDRFLAMLSHELRTPLTPILVSSLALSKDQKVPGRIRKELQNIARNVQLEARLIDDLLDISRINQGKLSLALETVDIDALLESALVICAESISAKRLVVHRELQATNSRLYGDPGRLQQVFWNLIKNAVKFTPPNGEIILRSSNSAPGWLRVEVIDTGLGITPEALPKVFDAFEQATPSGFEGLGLGLTISKTIVELHHGRIIAFSPGANRGATFVVELPNTIQNEVDTPSSRTATIASAQDATTEPVARIRILLVDDHRDTAAAVRLFLARAGYEVSVANNVSDALRLVEQQSFDLLLSDIALPDGNGWDLLQHLRELGHSFPGIALSGYGMEDDIARNYAAGFQAHLTKPFSPRQLQSVIDQVLDKVVAKLRSEGDH